MPTQVCLILPCYNEAARLDFTCLTRPPAGVTCVFVDDGSLDGTADLIRRHESSTLRLITLPRNVGKGEAVRQGFLRARDNGWIADAEWVGYWDADLATPLSELPRFLQYAAVFRPEADGIFGSRIYKLGSRISRSYHRHLLGRLFTTAASSMMSLECYDSQCGAKLLRTRAADVAFHEPFVSRWIFDIEILARLRGRTIIEYPVETWTDVKGSKLNLMKVALPTALDLVRIRRHYGPR